MNKEQKDRLVKSLLEYVERVTKEHITEAELEVLPQIVQVLIKL